MTRGRAVWQLAGPITRRSPVQIRPPLQEKIKLWQGSSVVEQWTHKPLVVGSIPTPATIKLLCRSGGTGRHARLKIVWLLAMRVRVPPSAFI